MSDPGSLQCILEKLKAHGGKRVKKQVVVIDAGNEHIHVRKCSSPEPKAQIIYKALGYEQKSFIRKNL